MICHQCNEMTCDDCPEAMAAEPEMGPEPCDGCAMAPEGPYCTDCRYHENDDPVVAYLPVTESELQEHCEEWDDDCETCIFCECCAIEGDPEDAE